MKHTTKITLIVLAMFVLTQLIGIYVVNYYSPIKVVDGITSNVTSPQLPFGFEPGQVEQEVDFWRAVSIFDFRLCNLNFNIFYT